jgi:diguanylate cyclase (GGDEF)-like protein
MIYKETEENLALYTKEFVDEYTACLDVVNDKHTQAITAYYSKIIRSILTNENTEAILTLFDELIEYKLSVGKPYIIVLNELYNLENYILGKFSYKNFKEHFSDILHIFKLANRRISYKYLLKYTDELIANNNLRHSSIDELLDKKLMVHYSAHLEWLSCLAFHIKNKDKQEFPELNPKMCEFGKWLHSVQTNKIISSERYNHLHQLHNALHEYAEKIYLLLEEDEYSIIITYLEKSEIISLSIGTELAMLNQIILNRQITKDSLTGALNRAAMDEIFQTQYELSLATSHPFVIAMCDLDLFKKINDTYGHLVGDEVLKLFVAIVKENIRDSDIIIRYGGEEFLIILPASKKENGLKTLTKIRTAFEKAFIEHNGIKIYETVSMGMVEIKPETLYKKEISEYYIDMADKALYFAKRSGRNKIKAL